MLLLLLMQQINGIFAGSVIDDFVMLSTQQHEIVGIIALFSRERRSTSGCIFTFTDDMRNLTN
ncbi:hypothetical protein BLA34_10545 [Ralstonia solanacearum]|nr:hypothetical protein BLA34_10545 [Ralstonia solanacearum]